MIVLGESIYVVKFIIIKTFNLTLYKIIYIRQTTLCIFIATKKS